MFKVEEYPRSLVPVFLIVVFRSNCRLNDMWMLDLTSLDSTLWQEVSMHCFFVPLWYIDEVVT